MGRLLGLVLLVYLTWRCLRAARRFLQAASEAPQRSLPVETLVRCATCGVYLRADRTLPGEGSAAYCSDTCRQRAAPAPAATSAP